MNYKILMLIAVFFLSTSLTFGCVYLENHDTCDYTTNQGLNIITINTQNIGEYESIEAEVQTPQGYSIPLEILDNNKENNQISFYQPRIFESFGVYEIEVTAILEDGISTLKNTFTLLYDNSNPLPPIVEEKIRLSTSQEPLKITGFVNNLGINSEVIVYNNGEEVDRVLVNQGEFESIFNIDKVNRISLQTVSKSGKTSSKYSFMYYSDEVNFESSQPARVNNVDFESINEVVKKNQNTIYSYSPYYHISGKASNGEVVFIQGVPIPVINGNFETFILLNEGEEDVCVRGVNSICQSITTIYSYEANEFNLDLNNKASISMDSMQANEFIEQMRISGDFTQNYLKEDLTITPVNRNLYFLEFYYPGIYEKKYMLVDRESPKIEIMASDILYPSSTIGIYLEDDTNINLETLRVNIGQEEYSIDDVISDESLGRANFLEFPTPTINSQSEQIAVSVEDIEGKLTQETKAAEFKGKLDSNLKVESVDNKILGNNIYVSSEDSRISLKIYHPELDSNLNRPIAFKSSEINKEFLSSYSINQNNEIELIIDESKINDNSKLNISVVVYDSINSNSKEEFDVDFNVVQIEESLSNQEEFRLIEKFVDTNLAIIELKNPFIDYSTLRVNGKADNYFIKGNYLFINTNSYEDIEIAYKDLNSNFRSFLIEIENLDVSLDLNSGENVPYLTYSLNSAKNIHMSDLLGSKRTPNLEVIPTNSQIHINPSFLEGLSVQENTFYTSRYETSKFSTRIQEQFSFGNYPTIEVDDIIQFRGLKKFTNQDSIVVQGRILGSDSIDSVSVGDVGCSIKERFFVCRGVDTSEYYNVHVVSVNGEEVDNNNSTNEDNNGVIEIINPSKSESSKLNLDLSLNENIFLSSEGHTFSSGDILFNFTPIQDGKHELYMNGELIKTFNVASSNTNEIQINLSEEEYLNRDTIGSELSVYVEDENNQESNSISMRFTRILNAIINIVIS